MRSLIVLVIVVFLGSLAGACAPELCPGQTKLQYYSSIKASPKVNQKKAKPSMIHASKNTSKRKPPK